MQKKHQRSSIGKHHHTLIATFCPFLAQSTGLWLFSTEAIRPMSIKSFWGTHIGVPTCISFVRRIMSQTTKDTWQSSRQDRNIEQCKQSKVNKLLKVKQGTLAPWSDNQRKGSKSLHGKQKDKKQMNDHLCANYKLKENISTKKPLNQEAFLTKIYNDDQNRSAQLRQQIYSIIYINYINRKGSRS